MKLGIVGLPNVGKSTLLIHLLRQEQSQLTILSVQLTLMSVLLQFRTTDLTSLPLYIIQQR